MPAFRCLATAEQATLGIAVASRDPAAARHFARYLTARNRGQPVFKAHFFEPIENADAWEDGPKLESEKR